MTKSTINLTATPSQSTQSTLSVPKSIHQQKGMKTTHIFLFKNGTEKSGRFLFFGKSWVINTTDLIYQNFHILANKPGPRRVPT
jgi:hypothetical protein